MGRRSRKALITREDKDSTMNSFDTEGWMRFDSLRSLTESSDNFDDSTTSFDVIQQSKSTQTKVRIRLHATNLPRQMRHSLAIRRELPTCYAVVTSASNSTSEDVVFGQTETIRDSPHPQWTETMSINYEYGTQLFFNVHIFHVASHDSDIIESGTRSDSIRSLSSRSARKISLGSAKFEVGDVLASPRQTKVGRLKTGGCVICRVETEVSDRSNGALFLFQLAAHTPLTIQADARRSWGHLFHTEPDTILEIARHIPSSSSGQRRHTTSTAADLSTASWMTVWRSQPVRRSLQPTWDSSQVDMGVLCENNDKAMLRVTVLAVQGRRRHAIGHSETTIAHLVEAASKQNQGLLYLSRGRGTTLPVGCLKVLEAEIVRASDMFDEPLIPPDMKRHFSIPTTDDTTQLRDDSETDELYLVADMFAAVASIVEPSPVANLQLFKNYIEKGCDLDCIVAIDFTSSNGDPRLIDSYHYQSDQSMNEYEETISQVIQSLLPYCSSNQFTVWGFGAKFDGVVRHLFQCGENAVVEGVDGILEAYKYVFQNDLIMSGPTEFLQVLQAAGVRAKRYHDAMATTPQYRRYVVLLIITDGSMASFDDTYRKLQVYGNLPLSIIFVGVGRESFQPMYKLCDGTNNATFIELRHHQHNALALGQAAFQLLPIQLCKYMQRHGY